MNIGRYVNALQDYFLCHQKLLKLQDEFDGLPLSFEPEDYKHSLGLSNALTSTENRLEQLRNEIITLARE